MGFEFLFEIGAAGFEPTTPTTPKCASFFLIQVRQTLVEILKTYSHAYHTEIYSGLSKDVSDGGGIRPCSEVRAAAW
ncbi:hypothetical protein Syn8016DRAFT_0858 [Synechococcus sp. WH 8016]|nr:hypothetical protein Syn8016DRAFT_0858 [Synechococcus sp. WH 8016]